MPEPPKIETGRPKLLDRVRAAIRLRHYSRRTEESYLGWIRRYIVFHGKRHPLEMGATEVAGFLTHLAERARVSASTQNQALGALLFLYRRVLERTLEPLAGVAWAKKMSHVPVVLSQEEVARVLDHLRGVMWLIAVLLYGAGLRLTECLDLRVKDLDFDRRQITVRVLQQRAALHFRITEPRSAPAGTPRKPSSRRSSRISAIAWARFSRASSFVGLARLPQGFPPTSGGWFRLLRMVVTAARG